MSDASVRAIDGRAVVTVGGSELLAPITARALLSEARAAASAAAAAVDADDADRSASLAQVAALTAPNVYADEASGRAAVADGRTFWTNLGAAGLGLYRRASGSASSLINTIITGAMLASASGAALIGHSQAAIGSIVRPVQAVLRDQGFNPKDFGAIGDGQYHRITERYTTLAAAQAAYPFVNDPPLGAPAYKEGVLQMPWTKDASGNPVVLWQNRSLDWAGHQAALNAASTNPNVRGCVRSPIGYYVLSDPLQMPSFCTLEGESRHGSVLYNQVVHLNSPMIVNKDPDAYLLAIIRDITILGGTHAVKLNVAREVANCVFSGIPANLQSVSVVEATSLQTTKFEDCSFGPPGSGCAIDVTGFPCNAIEFSNCRVSSGASGVIRLRGYDGVHWYGGSMEGNGRSLKATGTVSGTTLNITALNDGIGPVSPGDVVIGQGIAPGTVVQSLGSGSGGTGGYVLNQASTFGPGPLIIGPATVNLEYAGGAAASFTMSGVYVEGTPRMFMRSVGATGTDIDCCKFTWATNGEPFMFDTGADLVAIGTNHFDTDVVGPLNTLLYGSTPRLGGPINVWTSHGQKGGRVVGRNRNLAEAETFDILVFNRPTAQAGAGNIHTTVGKLYLVAAGYDSNGNVRSMYKTYKVRVQSISNLPITATLTEVEIDELMGPTTPQTLLARVKGSPGTTEVKIEVEAKNFNNGLPSQVFPIYEFGGAAAISSDAMRVSAA